MEQKKDSVVLDILEENKSTIELPIRQKRKSSIYIQQKQQQQNRRRTRSFPVESTSRKTRTPQYTPEKKLTPPNQIKVKQTKTIKESKYVKKYNNHNSQEDNKDNIIKDSQDGKFDNIDIDYKEYPTQDTINWDLGCFKIPKDCLVYVTQMLIVGTVIGVSLYKLSSSSDRPEFWASLLSGSVGYILPNPSLKKKN